MGDTTFLLQLPDGIQPNMVEHGSLSSKEVGQRNGEAVISLASELAAPNQTQYGQMSVEDDNRQQRLTTEAFEQAGANASTVRDRRATVRITQGQDSTPGDINEGAVAAKTIEVAAAVARLREGEDVQSAPGPRTNVLRKNTHQLVASAEAYLSAQAKGFSHMTYSAKDRQKDHLQIIENDSSEHVPSEKVSLYFHPSPGDAPVKVRVPPLRSNILSGRNSPPAALMTQPTGSRQPP